jgi:hypothetical protein
MSILRDVQRLLSITEQLAPKAGRSSLWRIAAKRALRAAALVESEWKDGDTLGAREALEIEQWDDPGQVASTTDLKDMLNGLLRKPRPDTSSSSEAKTPQKVVRLRPSKRFSPT